MFLARPFLLKKDTLVWKCLDSTNRRNHYSMSRFTITDIVKESFMSRFWTFPFLSLTIFNANLLTRPERWRHLSRYIRKLLNQLYPSVVFHIKTSHLFALISYRNQSFDLLWKSNYWFLCEMRINRMTAFCVEWNTGKALMRWFW